MTMPIGKIGPLSCLEIQTVLASTAGSILHHLVDTKVESRISFIATSNALKP